MCEIKLAKEKNSENCCEVYPYSRQSIIVDGGIGKSNRGVFGLISILFVAFHKRISSANKAKPN